MNISLILIGIINYGIIFFTIYIEIFDFVLLVCVCINIWKNLHYILVSYYDFIIWIFIIIKSICCYSNKYFSLSLRITRSKINNQFVNLFFQMQHAIFLMLFTDMYFLNQDQLCMYMIHKYLSKYMLYILSAFLLLLLLNMLRVFLI